MGSGRGSLVYRCQEDREIQTDRARRRDNELGTQSPSPLTDWHRQIEISQMPAQHHHQIGCILCSTCVRPARTFPHPSELPGQATTVVVASSVMFNKCSVGSNYLIPCRMRMAGDANLMRFGAVLLSGDFSVTLSVINQESLGLSVSKNPLIPGN